MTTSTPTAVATVSLSGVTKRYRSLAALDDVDLELGPGITGLLGPNGAGKTTMLRVMATVLRPDDGSVRLLGRDPMDPDARTDVRRRLGYQPQELGFPRGFTAFTFVNYMAVLKEWADRSSRAAEATTGLDPEQREAVRGVLADIAATSTMVISTHQTEDVAALCKRVVVLDSGRVHFDGTVTDLVALAQGRVWMADDPTPGALASWRTASGRHRNVGENVPPGAELVEPGLEDAYLLLRGGRVADDTTSSTGAEVPS